MNLLTQTEPYIASDGQGIVFALIAVCSISTTRGYVSTGVCLFTGGGGERPLSLVTSAALVLEGGVPPWSDL